LLLLSSLALAAHLATAQEQPSDDPAPSLTIPVPAPPASVDTTHLPQTTNVNPATSPKRLLLGALAALQSTQSLSADISHEVDAFSKRLIGSGVYYEQFHHPTRLVRMELRLQLGEQTSSLVQVCDGRYLWTYRRLHDDGTLRRLDVERITNAVRKTENLSSPVEMRGLPGLGGLPKLLHGLDASFDFTAAQAGILKLQDDQISVWRLEGRWKPDALARLLPDQKEAIEAGQAVDLSQLPPQVPDSVLLMLGHSDLFPYRIEYHRSPNEKKGGAASRPIVTMQLYDVVRNAPIPAHRFQYNPGELEFEDETGEFLESLGVGD
jgi:hypothetical protein